MANVYGDTPEEIEANKSAEDARRLAEFRAGQYAEWVQAKDKWLQLPNSKRGEFPQPPVTPRPIPR